MGCSGDAEIVDDPTLRRGLVTRFPAARWAVVVHPAATVSPAAALAPGVVVLAGAVVNIGAVVGPHAVVNTGAAAMSDKVLAAIRQVLQLAPAP